MGDDHASGATGDTPESLKAERANMEDAFAFVRQTVEYFDTLWDDGKSFDPERVAFHLQLKGPDLRLRVWAGITSPEGFQWHKEALAGKKAVGEEVLKDVAGFGQDLIDWAEDLEKREAQHFNAPPALGFLAGSGLRDGISTPRIVGAVADAEETGPILSEAAVLSAAATGAVVAGAATVIYGAYKGAVQPGLQAWSDASHARQSQQNLENSQADTNPDYGYQKGWYLYPGESRWGDGTIRTADGQIAVDANGNSVLTNEERQAIGENGSVWNLPPQMRGILIQSNLASTEYKDWYQVGASQNGFFVLVDFQKGNILVSLKTADTTGRGWLGDLQRHVKDLGASDATVNSQPATMVLDLRVQPGGAAAARVLIAYGKKFGVQVIVKEYP
jgi:hypothetical protein